MEWKNPFGWPRHQNHVPHSHDSNKQQKDGIKKFNDNLRNLIMTPGILNESSCHTSSRDPNILVICSLICHTSSRDPNIPVICSLIQKRGCMNFVEI